MKRKIIQIDETLCNACGICITQCSEGALKIIDGKAKIIKDNYCDGLGTCIGHCPTNALKIIEREAEKFEDPSLKKHINKASLSSLSEQTSLPDIEPWQILRSPDSKLQHWPIKIRLVGPNSPFLHNANLLIAGDCCPASQPNWHEAFLQDRIMLLGCPKFDDQNSYIEKFTQIFSLNKIASITVAEMEVPCCQEMHKIVQAAIIQAGIDTQLTRLVLSRNIT